MRIFILLISLVFTSCVSWKTVAPTVGGAIGGGVGALGGPGPALAGAGLGAAAGQIIKGEERVAQQAEELKALSEGDVSKLVELKLKEERGWFQSLIDGIYDILMISAVGMVLVYVAQFLYQRHFTKKINLNK